MYKNKRVFFWGGALLLGILAWGFTQAGLSAYKQSLAISPSSLSPVPQKNYQVPEGFRALTIPISQPFDANPSDFTDILASLSDESGTRILTLAQNIQILGGPWKSENNLFYSSFLVTPEEAQLLIYAQERGKLFISIRNGNDHQVESELLLPSYQISEGSLYNTNVRGKIYQKKGERVKNSRLSNHLDSP